MKNENSIGHLAACITILIWGTTFISTKILLSAFKPVEILFFRFIMGFLALALINPHSLKLTDKKHEITFAMAGLCGICLYYLLENIALTYTLASNVGVIVSTVPFFTAILTHLFFKGEEKLSINFFAGFITAMFGICLISFNGFKLQINIIGDILAFAAAFVWACYSVLTRKISSYGYNVLLATRREIFYGILFMIPTFFIFDFKLDLIRFSNPVYLFNIIFLGLGASAFCFVSWNFAVKILGAVKTSVYIYMVPVITVVTSALILNEKITMFSFLGTVLTIIGLFISESNLKIKKRGNENEFTE
ncbi:MAG: DMT family transporter [Clostridia bacterium]|jgi:drug/metabolite transporter (DMT)-like permease|nr:DMT family transporter [Clostridia bacterium]MCI2015517.1 DMT family transporter [Clostridia bacterium]